MHFSHGSFFTPVSLSASLFEGSSYYQLHSICEMKILNLAYVVLSVLKIRYQLYYFENVFPLPRAMDHAGNIERWLAVTSVLSVLTRKPSAEVYVAQL